MIEIIPNWHPIFVHFTIGLFSGACGLYVLAYLTSYLRIVSLKVVSDLETAARLFLWLVALITVGTVLAGLYAFSTVKHDEPAHVVMLIHRNFAFTTAVGIILLALWSGWRYYKNKKLSIIFVLGLLVVQGLLLTTGWLGAELVYRHGLGVISLPNSEGEEHHHHNGEGTMEPDMDHSNMPSMKNHEHGK